MIGMLFDYSDIWGRISEKPLWWFEGVPRYEPFHPRWLGGIEAALVQSKCQQCRADFFVGVCSPRHPHLSLKETMMRGNTLWLSDPPRVFCCQGGHAMTSLAIQVLQFWSRDGIEWIRLPELERELSDAELY
jgi:hypothetical protein